MKDRKYTKVLFAFLIFHFSITGIIFAGSLNFLKILPEARCASLGEAGCALISNPGFSGSNPALGAQAKNRDFSFTHIEWYDDIKYENVSFILPNKFGNMGLAAGYLYMPDITRTLIDSNNSSGLGFREEGKFTSQDLYFLLNYSKKIKENLSSGISLKYVEETIDDITAKGVMADFGIFYRSYLDMGFSLQNLGGKIKYLATQEDLPLNLKCGIGKTYFNKVLFLFELNYPLKNQPDYRLGIEYKLFKLINLRFGIKYRTDSHYDFMSFLTAGLGLTFPFFEKQGYYYSLDYSFSPELRLENVHRITLSGRF